MLEKILSSKSKVKILRLLIKNSGREFCLDDIVKGTGSSSGTIFPGLRSLVSLRMILVRKIGKTKLYKINERSPMYPKLKELFKKEESMLLDIAKEFVSELDKKNIKAIILFGSVARGDITEKSDIDILIVTINGQGIKKRVSKLTEMFMEKYDIEVMPIYMTQKELKDRRAKFDRFIINVIKEGNVLFGILGD